MYYEKKAIEIYNKIKLIAEYYHEEGFINDYMKNIETQKLLIELKSIIDDEIENQQHIIDVLNSYFWMIKWNCDSNKEDFELFKMTEFIIDDNLLTRTVQKTGSLNREISELRMIVQKQKAQIEKLYNALKQIDESVNCNDINDTAEALLKKLNTNK